jgi:hypothetical protein
MNFITNFFKKTTEKDETKKTESDIKHNLHGVHRQQDSSGTSTVNVNPGENISHQHVLNLRNPAKDRISAETQAPTLPGVDKRLTDFFTSPNFSTAVGLSDYYNEKLEKAQGAGGYAILADVIHCCLNLGVENFRANFNYSSGQLLSAVRPITNQQGTAKNVYDSLKSVASLLQSLVNTGQTTNFFAAFDELKFSSVANNINELKILTTILLAANSSPAYAQYAIGYLESQKVDLRATFAKMARSNLAALKNLLLLLEPKKSLIGKAFSALPSALHSGKNSAIDILRYVINEAENSEKTDKKIFEKTLLQNRDKLISGIQKSYHSDCIAIATTVANLFFEANPVKIEENARLIDSSVERLGDGAILKIFIDVANRISESGAIGRPLEFVVVLGLLKEKIFGCHNCQKLINVFSQPQGGGQPPADQLRSASSSSSSSPNPQSPDPRLSNSQSPNPASPPLAHESPQPATAFDAAMTRYLSDFNEEGKKAINNFMQIEIYGKCLRDLFARGIGIGSIIKFLFSGADRGNRANQRMKEFEALAKFESENKKTTIACQSLVTAFFLNTENGIRMGMDLDIINVFLTRANTSSSIAAAQNFVGLLADHQIAFNAILNKILDVVRSRANECLTHLLQRQTSQHDPNLAMFGQINGIIDNVVTKEADQDLYDAEVDALHTFGQASQYDQGFSKIYKALSGSTSEEDLIKELDDDYKQ